MNTTRIAAGIVVVTVLCSTLWCVVNLIALWPEVKKTLVRSIPVEDANSTVELRSVQRSWIGSDHMWLAPISLQGKLTPEVRAIILALLAGALGAAIQVFTSIGGYIGNKTFEQRWSVWFLLRLPIGSILGLFLMVGIQGGLPIESDTLDGGNPFQIVFLAGLAGLFSRSALDKLEDVFEVLLNSQRNNDREDSMKSTERQ